MAVRISEDQFIILYNSNKPAIANHNLEWDKITRQSQDIVSVTATLYLTANENCHQKQETDCKYRGGALVMLSG